MSTIGKAILTIKYDEEIEHLVYVVRDDALMEYDGILGTDFIRRHKVVANYNTRRVSIGKAQFKLQPYIRIKLKPRSETIVQCIANKNKLGITKAEETAPGIFIGSCLVAPQDYICPVTILNTTETELEIITPQVTIDELETDIKYKI
ncbi:hypothetical protein ALC57_16107 [Trachymyrmex cornetzi]|uniref:Uncharacterized protein n=1 Tax=Trachymyrmex cornetzi TaxID=471704 RepID=A0A151IVW6_9HYME|nr:hypothetical protein ALC57_16107 [Trachymyrmex cornetzi]